MQAADTMQSTAYHMTRFAKCPAKHHCMQDRQSRCATRGLACAQLCVQVACLAPCTCREPAGVTPLRQARQRPSRVSKLQVADKQTTAH